MSKFEIMQQNKLWYELGLRKSLNNERYQQKKYEKFYQWISYDGVIFLATLLFIWLLYYLGLKFAKGTSRFSDIVVIVWLWSMFISDLDKILRIIRQRIIDKWIDVEKLRELLDSLDTWIDIHEWDEFVYTQWQIEFKDVAFSYATEDEWEKVFESFSVALKGQQKTALVWLSWSWKSTMAKLIAWYLRADTGEIRVDGSLLPLADASGEWHVSLLSYYKHIGYLSQEPNDYYSS